MPHPFLSLGFNSWSQKFSRGNVPAAVAAFLQYVTTSVSSFTLLSTGTVDYEVDWGDGTTESLTTNNPTHTYSSAGTYTIKVTPAEGSTYSPYYNGDASAASIASVSSTGGSQLDSFTRSFYGASNMTSFSGDLDTSHITGNGFERAWRDCSSLTSFPQIDTSGANNFGNSWRDCSSLTSFPLLDTSSVTYFYYTWANCSGLTSFPLIDTSSGVNFGNAWRNCSGLTSFPQLDTSSGTSFSQCWIDCSGLTSFPQLDFSRGTNFFSAWFNCTGLTSFPANMFDTTGTLSSSAFNGAWRYCALTAQSIENILVSLDTNGASNITLSINSGTNAAKTTWSAAANTAYTNLINKGWTISYNA